MGTRQATSQDACCNKIYIFLRGLLQIWDGMSILSTLNPTKECQAFYFSVIEAALLTQMPECVACVDFVTFAGWQHQAGRTRRLLVTCSTCSPLPEFFTELLLHFIQYAFVWHILCRITILMICFRWWLIFQDTSWTFSMLAWAFQTSMGLTVWPLKHDKPMGLWMLHLFTWMFPRMFPTSLKMVEPWQLCPPFQG